MVGNPGARFRILRRVTVAVSATCVAAAGLLYLQVSGGLSGAASAVGLTDSTTTSTTDPAAAQQAPQAPATDPGSAAGLPVVRSGGS